MAGDLVLDEPSYPSYTPAEPGFGRTFGDRLKDAAPSLGHPLDTAVQAGADIGSPEGRELAGAAFDATMFTRLISSRDVAMGEAAQQRIDRVAQATGVTLENPWRGGYAAEAMTAARAARLDGSDEDVPTARSIFEGKLAQVRQLHADKLSGIDLDTPIDDIGRELATSAEQRLTFAQQGFEASGRSGVAGLAAEAAGGITGGWRDPLTIASWAAGPTGAGGKTALMRVLSEGGVQAAFNLALTSIEKPFAQAFREERGAPVATRLLTPTEAGHALLFGFLGGVAVRGGIEFGKSVLGAGERIAAADHAAIADRPAGVSADVHEAAIEQATAHVNDPVNVPPPALVPILPEAIAGAAVPPPGYSRFYHGGVPYTDGPRWLTPHQDYAAGYAAKSEDTGLVHYVDIRNDSAHLKKSFDDAGTDQTATFVSFEAPEAIAKNLRPLKQVDRMAELRAIAAKASDPADVVESMRLARELGDAAIASGEPDLVNAAKLATLSDPAWQAVRDGTSSPEHGLIAAEQAANPSDHSAVLERLAHDNPADTTEARLIAADEVEGQAERRNVAALRSDAKPKPRVGVVPEERRSLMQFLAGRGGVAETPELRDLFAGKSSYIRPYGKLVKPYVIEGDRKRLAAGGVYADRIDRRAAEAFDAGYITEPTERALLDALGAEARGTKVFRAGGEPAPSKAAVREDNARQLEKIAGDVDNQIAEFGGMSGSKASQERIRKQAIELLTASPDRDTADALDHAIMLEHLRAEGRASRGRTDVPDAAAGGHPPDGGQARPAGPAGDTGGERGPGGAGGHDAQGGGPAGGQARSGRRGVDGQLELPGVALEPARAAQAELPLAGGEAEAAIRAQLKAQLEAPPAPDRGRRKGGALFDQATQHDMMDMVPSQREDGSPVLLAPEDVPLVGERQSLFADLARSCQS